MQMDFIIFVIINAVTFALRRRHSVRVWWNKEEPNCNSWWLGIRIEEFHDLLCADAEERQWDSCSSELPLCLYNP